MKACISWRKQQSWFSRRQKQVTASLSGDTVQFIFDHQIVFRAHQHVHAGAEKETKNVLRVACTFTHAYISLVCSWMSTRSCDFMTRKLTLVRGGDRGLPMHSFLLSCICHIIALNSRKRSGIIKRGKHSLFCLRIALSWLTHWVPKSP